MREIHKSVEVLSFPAELIQQKNLADVWTVRVMAKKGLLWLFMDIYHQQPFPFFPSKVILFYDKNAIFYKLWYLIRSNYVIATFSVHSNSASHSTPSIGTWILSPHNYEAKGYHLWLLRETYGIARQRTVWIKSHPFLVFPSLLALICSHQEQYVKESDLWSPFCYSI